MMHSVFITGTDTGVGKTVVTAAWTAKLRAANVDAVPMKAVQTGCDASPSGLIAPDLSFALRMAGVAANEEEPLLCPYRYEPACSPHLAARQAGESIEPARIVHCFRALMELRDAVIVEGAGGVLVPLGKDSTMLDLMVALALPVVVVARPSLGTINHTLLSLAAIRRAGLHVAGIVLVDATAQPWTFIEEDNQYTLENLGQVPVLGHIPYIDRLHDEAFSSDDFLQCIDGCLELEVRF